MARRRTTHQRSGRPPTQALARLLAPLLALLALAMAAAPWLGRIAPPLDLVSAALPFSLLPALIAIGLDRFRSAAGYGALGALLLASFGLAPEWRLEARAAPNSAGLRIVSHNLAAANADPQLTVATLLGSNADILLLQEADGAMAPHIGALRARYPYGSRCRRPCSLLILSRWPTLRVRYRFRDAQGRPFGPALMQTRVTRPGLPPFTVATLHLSRHRSVAAARQERQALADAAARVDQRGLIIGGDFNLTPWSDALRTLDRQMASLQRVTRALFTFPARVGGWAFPLPLVPIDHVYVGPGWRVARITRLSRTGSDHYPVEVELVWHG